MKKKSKTKPRGRNAPGGEIDPDWTPLYRALQDSIEWALDIAAKLAAPYPEEVESIENVRAFVRAKLAGSPDATVRIGDLMLTFGILIAAIELDLGVDEDRGATEIKLARDVVAGMPRYRTPAAAIPRRFPVVRFI